ncbi:MAG: energy-coupling factor ABC transporter ATP-binding protein [Coriobacteriales bacterium]
MIRFEHVSAAYTAETPILNDVSFTIEDGEFIAFVGTNGAGKSTTMRLINGLLKPTAGQVLIDGTPTTQLKTSELARRVGFLFQNPDRQICCNSVRDELEFGFKAQGALTDEARARVDAIIDEFGFDPDAEPYLLNRGTRQLLALASIIVMEPPVIVLDEPTTGLDFRECQKVMEIVARLHREGKTIVMVCHDMEVVGDYAQRIVVMTRGELVAQGPTFQLLRNPEVLHRADLVPPQVVAISMELVARHPELTGTAVDNANTLQELTAALQGIAEEKGALR